MHLAKVWALANTLLCTTLSKSLALTTEISTNQLQKRDMVSRGWCLPEIPYTIQFGSVLLTAPQDSRLWHTADTTVAALRRGE